MQKVSINPSIAAIVNISGIGSNELVPIYLTAPVPWIGTYTFKLFDCDQKNNEIQISNPIQINDNVMTLIVDPIAQDIPAGLYFYEITHTEGKRIVFKGSLNISK